MSVVAQSPFTTGKRLFEDDAGSDTPHQPGAKRARCFDSPAGRCRPSAHPSPSHIQAAVHSSAVAALKALFSGMDEQAVESVLAECGQDIDAAIRRLTELKLSTAEQQQAAATQQQHQQRQQQQPAANGSSDTAQLADGGQQGAAAGPQTAEQWVDALVQEMAAAKDFGDARSRAAKMLQAFEQFVSSRSKESPTTGVSQARADEALRENAILKRAVQIQNAKLQEASAKDQEIAGLKQMIGQYEERLRHLELSNYSLALHLQKATDSSAASINRPPDVF